MIHYLNHENAAGEDQVSNFVLIEGKHELIYYLKKIYNKVWR